MSRWASFAASIALATALLAGGPSESPRAADDTASGEAEAAQDCGCGGPKSNPSYVARQLTQRAKATDDPAAKRRLLETALSVKPGYQPAENLLEAMQ